MNKTLVSVLAILATASAFAASTKFPDSEGNHDISNPLAWGGTIPEGDVKTSGKNVTYNANAGDVTFTGSFACDTGSQTFDFISTPTRKIQLGGSTDKTYMTIDGSYLYYNFLCGEWTLTRDFRLGYDKSSTKNHMGVIVSNATISCQRVCAYGHDNRLEFTGGAKLVTSSNTDLPSTADTKTHAVAGTMNDIVFSDKSSFTCSGNVYLIGSTNTLTVEDSEFTCTKDFIILENDIEDEHTVGCLTSVKNGSLKARSIILRGSENELVVSNGALSATSYGFTISGENNSVRLQGDGTTLTFKKNYDFVFEDAANDKLIISDGAEWNCVPTDNLYYLAKSGRNNHVILEREGEFNVAGKPFVIGALGIENNGVGVFEGGKFVGRDIYLGGVNSSLVLTNGSVSLSGQIYLGRSIDADTKLSTNAVIEIAGAKSKLMSNKLFACNGSTVRFVVPDDGFDETPWVLDEKITITEGCAISVDAEAFQSKLDDSENVVLMKWTGDGSSVNANVLAAANAELAPKKMKLIFDKDNKQLVLRVRSLKPGLTIILR